MTTPAHNKTESVIVQSPVWKTPYSWIAALALGTILAIGGALWGGFTHSLTLDSISPLWLSVAGGLLMILAANRVGAAYHYSDTVMMTVRIASTLLFANLAIMSETPLGRIMMSSLALSIFGFALVNLASNYKRAYAFHKILHLHDTEEEIQAKFEELYSIIGRDLSYFNHPLIPKDQVTAYEAFLGSKDEVINIDKIFDTTGLPNAGDIEVRGLEPLEYPTK